MCDGSCGKKRRGPRSLNGRKQKSTGDKPSIVCILETSGIAEAASPPQLLELPVFGGCWAGARLNPNSSLFSVLEGGERDS